MPNSRVRPQKLQQSSARSHLYTLNSSIHFLGFRHNLKVKHAVTLRGTKARLHITSLRDENKLHSSQPAISSTSYWYNGLGMNQD